MRIRHISNSISELLLTILENNNNFDHLFIKFKNIDRILFAMQHSILSNESSACVDQSQLSTLLPLETVLSCSKASDMSTGFGGSTIDTEFSCSMQPVCSISVSSLDDGYVSHYQSSPSTSKNEFCHFPQYISTAETLSRNLIPLQNVFRNTDYCSFESLDDKNCKPYWSPTTSDEHDENRSSIDGMYCNDTPNFCISIEKNLQELHSSSILNASSYSLSSDKNDSPVAAIIDEIVSNADDMRSNVNIKCSPCILSVESSASGSSSIFPECGSIIASPATENSTLISPTTPLPQPDPQTPENVINKADPESNIPANLTEHDLFKYTAIKCSG